MLVGSAIVKLVGSVIVKLVGSVIVKLVGLAIVLFSFFAELCYFQVGKAWFFHQLAVSVQTL